MKQYSISLLPCLMMYYIVSLFVWCPCMAIDVVSAQYNGVLLPDIILLTHHDNPHGNLDCIVMAIVMIETSWRLPGTSRRRDTMVLHY